MKLLKDLISKDFCLVEPDTPIQSAVSTLLTEKRSLIVFKEGREHYYVDKEAFLQAIAKGSDIRIAKVRSIGKKTLAYPPDMPFHKFLQELDRSQDTKSALVIISQGEKIYGVIFLPNLDKDEVHRAKIASKIYEGLDGKPKGEQTTITEMSLSTPQGSEVLDQDHEEMAQQLRRLLKAKKEETPPEIHETQRPPANPSIALLYNPIHILHKAKQDSPENPERLIRIINFLKGRANTFKDGCVLISDFPAVSEKEILLVHDKDYLEFLKGYGEKGGGFLGDSTYLNYNSVSVACFAAGAAIKAANLVLSGEHSIAWALMRPPGHHASANKYGGFCLFNNAAITTRYIQQRKGMKKVLILDWDGHAANGTQSIFYSDGTVMLISLHQDPKHAYPHSGFINEIGIEDGRGKNLNIVMPAMASDQEYIEAFKTIVEPVSDAFAPDFVIGCNGFDAHYEDTHTDLGLTSDGYYNIGEYFKKKYLGKSIIITEGGYHQYNGILSVALLDGLAGNKRSIKEASPPPKLGHVQQKAMRKVFEKNMDEIKVIFKEYYPQAFKA